MNSYHDPELDDVLQDPELRRVASLLHAARTPEPPLDDAFRTGLRRQLMQEAWSMAEGRGGSTSRRMRIASSSGAVRSRWASNGFRPVSSSYRTTPSE